VEIHDLHSAIAVLDWDQQVNMPAAGAEGRANQLSLLSRLSHEKFVDGRIGELLESLKAFTDGLDPESDEACLVKVTRREYDRNVKVPSSFVAEFTRTTSNAHVEWEKAKAASSFSLFQPWLEKIFDLRREYAGFFAPYDHIYDPLLAEFEPGLKTAEVKEIFAKVRPAQVELIREIGQCPEIDDSFLHQMLDSQKQWELGVEASTAIGFDWSRGRQDRSVHPFTTTFDFNDVRITTRIMADNFASGFFSTMHESGHAMYEQGISPSLRHTPLCTGASLGIHESQSRLWENLVGRSFDFWVFFYPRLRNKFPGSFDNVSLKDFYRGVNRVRRSLIRTESDEATYNLHIMLRLEIEISVLEGRVAVSDLPEIWNARMEEYLGVVPDNDARGILQDVHWAGGAVGYFPTYALGNMISAQIWECVNRDIPDLPEKIRQGSFNELRGWLASNIYRHGAKFEPQALVQKVTGSKIDPAAYIRYLNRKYKEIYSL
ncbi:MAG: carboxypeptidase M32, partial [Lentisphaerota bacterium]